MIMTSKNGSRYPSTWLKASSSASIPHVRPLFSFSSLSKSHIQHRIHSTLG